MNIRLIVSDIDGTLLPSGGRISRRTAQAVQACRARGVEFAVCSGRWYPSAREIVDQLGVEDGYMICCNGGAVLRTDGTPLMETGLDADQARAVYELLRDERVLMTAYVRQGICQIHGQYLRIMDLPETSARFGEREYRVVKEDIGSFEAACGQRPYKMEAHGDDFALLKRLRGEIEKLGLQVNSAFPSNLEIMPRGTGKGAATRFLTQYLGAQREQVMGFGDYGNDLPMFEACGYPVAVGNALEEVKRAAWAIAPACAEDGVAWALHKYVLGDEEA